MLIHLENSSITDYANNDGNDFQDNMKNSFVTEFADYPIFNTKWEMLSSLTTLTTLICNTTLKIILSLTHADYTDFQDYIKNIYFINDYADYTDLQDYIKKNSSLTTLTTLIIKITWKSALSFIQLTTLIYWLHWIRWYIDYADYADILTTPTTLIYWLRWLRWYIDYTDYADYTDIFTTLTWLIYWLHTLR